jgi:membrane-bound serine protease (ClpP class)
MIMRQACTIQIIMSSCCIWVNGSASVINDFDHNGSVIIHGENWLALSDARLHKGQKVKVTDIQGLTLKVEPLQNIPVPPSTQEKEK